MTGVGFSVGFFGVGVGFAAGIFTVGVGFEAGFFGVGGGLAVTSLSPSSKNTNWFLPSFLFHLMHLPNSLWDTTPT